MHFAASRYSTAATRASPPTPLLAGEDMAAMNRASNGSKILTAVVCGLLVGGISAGIHWSTLSHDQSLLTHVMLGDLVASLTTMIVCLAIQLRQEELHFTSAMSRTAIVSELNHHVRNAIFPLCLALQKSGDKDATLIANDAVERINIALREATADAISGRIAYTDEARSKSAQAH
ncbi:MAG TPA: hypothetical protein VFQ00_07855 [Terriglobales bacterium]|nr:hypothetical protein [Terriglobales bacterium]